MDALDIHVHDLLNLHIKAAHGTRLVICPQIQYGAIVWWRKAIQTVANTGLQACRLQGLPLETQVWH